MTIKQLQKICHKIAKGKGFWDEENPNIAEKLMLIVSELGEACEALREGKFQNLPYMDTLEKGAKLGKSKEDRIWEKDTFEDELADTIIRICDLAEYMGIDLEWHLKKKIAYNKKRSYKHNKKF